MDWAEPALVVPPTAQQVEISIFGPGVGECIVVHLGSGTWMIVDSCVDRGAPVALAYLNALQVPLEAVTAIVATHWHDDHIRGLSALVEHYPAARFMMSAALQDREALTLFATARQLYDRRSGVDEMHDILQLLHQRSSTRPGRTGPQYLSDGKRFLTVDHEDGPPSHCWSLSPSSAEVTACLNILAESIPEFRSAKRRIVSSSPNHAAVAIQVERGDFRALLGSDLEERGDPESGWSAVIANHINVGGRSGLYKVAHHGSETAHHAGIFDQLCEAPASIVTPYRRSRLPRNDDLSRLDEHSSAVHMTADPRVGSPPRRPRAVERTIKTVTKAHGLMSSKMGLVRVRSRTSAPGHAFEHFGAAHEVSSNGST